MKTKIIRTTMLLLAVFLAMLSITFCKESNDKVNSQKETESVEGPIPGAWQTNMYFPLLKDKRVAVAGNHTSEVDGVHLVDTLLSSGINVVKVFSPEHGFRGEAAAGEHVYSETDSKTGLPIISLYGSRRRPNPFHLADVDIILFDIQDVGTRFYTYISTMTYIMETAAKLRIPVIILDRPNPNGHYVDGPVLEPEFSSFVGLHPVPVVHGMTIGEYALMINDMGWLRDNVKCELTIISIKNYDHSTRYIPPVPPSPNLPNIQSIYLYPSLCFFEGTEISIGRGTDYPFQVYGHSLLPNDIFRFSFKPESRREAPNPPQLNKTCFGEDLRQVSTEDLKSKNHLDLTYLIKAYEHYPEKDDFFNDFFNLLAGNSKLKKQIINNTDIEEIRESWQKGLKEFKEIRKRYLLYPDFE